MRIFSPLKKPRRFIILGLIATLLMLSGCRLRTRPVSSIPTVDARATDETKSLFMKLWMLADSNQTLFGHQDDTYYGVGWVNEPGRSDVLEVSGSYPAVYGWEIGDIELGLPTNLDGVPYDSIRDKIIEGYRRGGVITISWHMNNPVTYQSIGSDPEDPYPGRSWDRTPAVSTILPGGSNHDIYRNWLDAFAAFDRSLTVSGVSWNEDEHLVPVIFRPFHEHNCRTFWWGRRNLVEHPDENATEEEYIALWRFTVDYLREEADLHNLLYAYSPDARCLLGRDSDYSFPDLDTFETTYNYAYPGDDYVDVLGLDYYQNAYPYRGIDGALFGLVGFQSSLDMLVETSHSRPDLKIPALTETGGQRWELPNSEIWWTNFLYRGLIGTRSSGGQVAWALVWRNASVDHYFAPYPSHPSEDDFVEFKDRPMIHFEDEIPFNLYTWP